MYAATLIREARLRSGLTQSELARRASTQQSVIARWESGNTRPSMETVARLVAACGLEMRLELSEPDSAEWSLAEGNLQLSPAERLDKLVDTVRFIHAGREALSSPVRKYDDGC